MIANDPCQNYIHMLDVTKGLEDRAYHYFGRFTHAAFRCQSIFGSAGIVSAAVER
jgi:hypothetical protein